MSIRPYIFSFVVEKIYNNIEYCQFYVKLLVIRMILFDKLKLIIPFRKMQNVLAETYE